jgi:hypothetical protein
VYVAFVTHLARPAVSEAGPLATALGTTEYETRLALATPPPCILLMTSERGRAEDAVAAIRARGHGAYTFDGAQFVPSDRMPRVDDFRLDADGVRRVHDGALLPYGDVFAILRAVHDTSGAIEHPSRQRSYAPPRARLGSTPDPGAVVTKVEEREHVAYFFRRSGEAPWILRERHASYTGLGRERAPVAFQNFMHTLARIRELAPMAVSDDRLLRRRVAERLVSESALRSSRDGVDLLAHLLAMSIANQGGSPYR